MSDSTNNSLIHLGNLSKPANTLIKKISNAVGEIFEPHQIRRVARAKADAAMIAAKSDIEITDLARRTAYRWLNEETRRQTNMEDITANALADLHEGARVEDVDDDWITFFFDKCRIVSNTMVQTVWSRLLVNECGQPGTISKRTVRILGDLSTEEVTLFDNLCGSLCSIDGDPFKPVTIDLDWSIPKHQEFVSELSESDSNLIGDLLVTNEVHRQLQSTGLIVTPVLAPEFDAALWFGRTITWCNVEFETLFSQSDEQLPAVSVDGFDLTDEGKELCLALGNRQNKLNITAAVYAWLRRGYIEPEAGKNILNNIGIPNIFVDHHN